MKSKVIYVTENLEHILEHSLMDIHSPKQLDKLLSEGWFISNSTKMKVKHPELDKRVAVNRIELSQESGVTVQGGSAENMPPHVLSELVKGNEGLTAAVALIAKSLQQQTRAPGESNNSYLGNSIANQIPGVGAVTPLSMQAAYGTGADAAKQGADIDTCPFPEGSYPYSQWIDGFLNGNGKADPEMMVAMEEGRAAAQGGDNDEVTCRWAQNTRGYIAWLFAFKKRVVASNQGVSMHLLGQGWKQQPDGTLVVAAIAVSRCTNGMDGWNMHVGCYNPACGETIQHAVWEFKVASGNLMGVLNPYVVCEMATWGDKQSAELTEVLVRIEALLRDMKEKLCPS